MMKRHGLFVILIILNYVAAAQNIYDLVEKGNMNYMSGNYEMAIQDYQAVVDSGYESAELYYNLGNAYYKSNKFTMALVNFEKASLLDPDDKEIQHNLEMARQLVIDKIDKLPEFLPKLWYRKFTGLLKTDQWAYISMIAFPVSLLLFLVYFFVRRIGIRKTAFWLAIVVMLISISTFIFSNNQKKLVYDNSYAIIITPSVTIKSSPDENGTELFQLHEGTKVEIIDQLGDWKEIKLSDGNVGWLKISDLIRLSESNLQTK
jgi:tetratricopeptide (TPR) repeat protein